MGHCVGLQAPISVQDARTPGKAACPSARVELYSAEQSFFWKKSPQKSKKSQVAVQHFISGELRLRDGWRKLTAAPALMAASAASMSWLQTASYSWALILSRAGTKPLRTISVFCAAIGGGMAREQHTETTSHTVSAGDNDNCLEGNN